MTSPSRHATSRRRSAEAAAVAVALAILLSLLPPETSGAAGTSAGPAVAPAGVGTSPPGRAMTVGSSMASGAAGTPPTGRATVAASSTASGAVEAGTDRASAEAGGEDGIPGEEEFEWETQSVRELLRRDIGEALRSPSRQGGGAGQDGFAQGSSSQGGSLQRGSLQGGSLQGRGFAQGGGAARGGATRARSAGPEVAGARPRLVAMYGVGRNLMAEVQVGARAFLYLRGQALPVGHAGDAAVYRLRDMNGACVHLERGEDRHSLCLRALLGEARP